MSYSDLMTQPVEALPEWLALTDEERIHLFLLHDQGRSAWRHGYAVVRGAPRDRVPNAEDLGAAEVGRCWDEHGGRGSEGYPFGPGCDTTHIGCRLRARVEEAWGPDGWPIEEVLAFLAEE